MLETVENILEQVLHYAIILVDIVGALIILFFTVRALISLLRKKHCECSDHLTRGISTGLSFLLVSEVLNTIIARSWEQIGMVCTILLMRAGMTLLVHWESKMEHSSEGSKE